MKAQLNSLFFNKIHKLTFDAVIKDLEDANLIKSNNEYVRDFNFEIDKNETYKDIESTILDALDNAKFNFV